MGSPSTDAVIHLELRIALQSGAYRAARRLADLLPRLEPIEKLSLAALAAREDPDDFDALVQSWICQAIEEGLLALDDLSWVMPRLDRLALLGWQEAARLTAVLSHRDPN
jgi:hypothetical protein